MENISYHCKINFVFIWTTQQVWRLKREMPFVFYQVSKLCHQTDFYYDH